MTKRSKYTFLRLFRKQLNKILNSNKRHILRTYSNVVRYYGIINYRQLRSFRSYVDIIE